MGVNNIIHLLKNKSLRYVFFRSLYELERKMGVLALKYPTKLKSVTIPSLAEWRENKSVWFFDDRGTLTVCKVKSQQLKEKMEHFIKGDVLFFSKTWRPLGLDYDWVTNPETGYHYDIRHCWTKVNDFSKDAGDIKYVWEKSRFSWLLTICRYDYHFDEDHAEFVLLSILDWIEKNPLNCGPNYKCSQEISIRILNWLFALSFYRKSEHLTEERWRTIMTSIYWQTDHVYKNINFSRIALRNNHAITESLTLYLMGLFFPKMKGSGKWRIKGKQWFEEEIKYQIEEDGTYIQDSMTYHRVVVQLLTYAISLADKNGDRFEDIVYEKAYKSVFFLYQCQEPGNGWLPNYGANDGALFFPLSDADYRDFRPQLDALHVLLTGKPLYETFLEDVQWVGQDMPKTRKQYDAIEKRFGVIEFQKSGYYLFRESETLSFIRCGSFKTKGTTDQLHLDIWYKGKNVLMDGGSFMYNTEERMVRYFAGTESHNTIMLGDYDQMQKGDRFMWFYPPSLLSVQTNEEYFFFVFEGKVRAFRQLGREGVVISRRIKKMKGSCVWEVIDTIEGASMNMVKRQLWHTDSELLMESNGERKDMVGWVSDYYGVKRPIKQIEIRTNGDQIITKIQINK